MSQNCSLIVWIHFDTGINLTKVGKISTLKMTDFLKIIKKIQINTALKHVNESSEGSTVLKVVKLFRVITILIKNPPIPFLC